MACIALKRSLRRLRGPAWVLTKRAMCALLFGVVTIAASHPQTAFAGPTLPPGDDNVGEINVTAGTSTFDFIVGRFAIVERYLFGNSVVTGSLAAFIDPDPYFAFELDLTNASTSALSISMNVFSPTVPVLSPFPPVQPFPTFQGQFNFDLYDANGDGSAYYGGGSAQFSLLDNANGAGVPLTQNYGVYTDETGPGGIPNVGPMPVPPSFTGQWDTIGLFHTGFNELSPGDRIVLKGFGCIALPGGDPCPTPPDLSALVIPEPSKVWLFVAGLGAVIGFARLRRMSNPTANVAPSCDRATTWRGAT